MSMKNKLRIDLFREIKRSPFRFLSILFIIFLGTAFFSGLRSSGLDMKLSADAYYDDRSLMDAKVLSTYGFTTNELSLLKKVEGILSVTPARTKDVLLSHSDKEFLIKLIELTPGVNEPYLLKGRLPKSANEALIDSKLFQKEGYQLGDNFSLKSKQADISSSLSVNEITITGVCHLPYFLETNRGTSKLGDGSIDAFFLLPKEAFQSEIYTEVYLQFLGTKSELTYSKDYENKAKSILSRLEALEPVLAESRHTFIQSEAEKKIKKNENKVSVAEEKVATSEKEFAVAENKLKLERRNLDTQKEALNKIGSPSFALAKLQKAEELLKVEELKLTQAKKLFEKKIKKEKKKITKAKEKLAKAKKELADLEYPKIYTLGRDKFPDYESFKQNANRMDNIGSVFPIIFFLVATLVSLTAMTRMVDEGRINMGTLKALGFSNIKIMEKYLLYSLLATMLGGVFGVLIGEKYFPLLIITSYQTLFISQPYVLTPFNLKEGALALFFAVLSTGGASLISSFKVLKENPASLMRPLPPKHGRRVLLEKVPFIWTHLNFSKKSTIRNLIRYKKRFFMTIFGIGSCTGLLLVGFGLRDSIEEIAKKQFVSIFTYDGRISLEEKIAKEEKIKLSKLLLSHEKILDSKEVYFQTIDAKNTSSKKQVTLFVPKNEENLSAYIKMRDSKSKKELTLSKQGAYISEKLARLLKVKEGDDLILGRDESENISIQIEKIIENYMLHYVILSSEAYETAFRESPPYNNLFLSFNELNEEEETALGKEVLSLSGSNGIHFVSEDKKQIDSMLKVLNLVILVLISSAGLLAFVVLYNLNSINIMERKRELATLKVLGFFDGEVSSYVYRENIILTLFGILFGSLFGTVLHRFVVQTVEVDLMMFGRKISLFSYGLSILVTFFFSFLVNLIMHFVLKRIDMIESLKSIE